MKSILLSTRGITTTNKSNKNTIEKISTLIKDVFIFVNQLQVAIIFSMVHFVFPLFCSIRQRKEKSCKRTINKMESKKKEFNMITIIELFSNCLNYCNNNFRSIWSRCMDIFIFNNNNTKQIGKTGKDEYNLYWLKCY